MSKKNVLYYIDLYLKDSSLYCEKSTIKEYTILLEVFGKYLRNVGKVDIKDFTKDTIIGFKTHLLERNASHKTRNKYLNLITSLGNFLADAEIIKDNPALLVKKFKVLRKHSGYVYILEHERVLMQIKAEHPRLWGFLYFMVYGFWRPFEILNLTAENIGLKEIAQFDPRKTKGKRRIVKPISPKLEEAIQELKLREIPKGLYLFSQGLEPGIEKKTTRYVSDNHNIIAKKIGLPPEISIYKWRHTAARNAKDKNVDVGIIQAIMGHQNEAQTRIYIGKINTIPRDALDNL